METGLFKNVIIPWNKSAYSGSIMMFLAILNMLNTPFQQYYEQTGNLTGAALIFGVDIVFNVMFLIELIICMILIGLRAIILKGYLALQIEILFQFILIVFAYPKAATLLADEDSYNSGSHAVLDLTQIIILFRLSRIFPFLTELQQWDFFARAVNVMKGPFFNLVLCLFSVYYLWTLIGIEIYGGKIDTKIFEDIAELNPDTEIGPTYMWLNFNDFASGLITLFSMMLFNNWQFIWGQFNFAIENDLITNGFFLSFMAISQYVILNILMAFIIDVYTSIEDQVRKEKDEKEALVLLGMQEL